MAPSARQRLADIYSNISQARSYVADIDKVAFVQSVLTQDAVLRRLQNASEALTRLQREFPDVYQRLETAYPNVPWVRFQGLANRYRRGYDVIDLSLVWQDLSTDGVTESVLRALGDESKFLE